MSKPLLNNSRFESLIKLVRPPSCQWSWAVKANDEFELTDSQRQQLQDAIWFMYRYYTKTTTDEEKKMIGKVLAAEFKESTSNTFYSGGWIGKRQY